MFDVSGTGVVVFGLSIRWYGVLIALGVLLAVLLAVARQKRLGLPHDTTLDVAIWGVPVGIICARIYYVIFTWDYFSAHPADIVNIRAGGLAIYGGVIGGVVVGLCYARIKKLSFARIADLAAPSLALGQAVGRWGNFLNQEAYGGAVTNPRLCFFPLSVLIDGSGWHYATFFYESLWCLLIVVFILLAERKHFFRRAGDIFGAYIFLYALERALVEGLRSDSLYIGPIRVSQLLSLVLMLAVCAVLARRSQLKPRALGALSIAAIVPLGVCLACDNVLFSITFALITMGLTLAIYTTTAPKQADRA